MSETAGSPIVALLLPELLGGAVDEARLRTTLSASKPVRVLLCLPDQNGYELIATLDRLGSETQILLGPAVAAPTTRAFVLRAPPGTLPTHQTEFALALSDILLAAPGSDKNQWVQTASLLGKPIIAPGDPLPTLPPVHHVSRGLDPDLPGRWRACWRCFWGRTEQGLLELLAFGWRGWNDKGVTESLKRLRKCVGLKWRPSPYFGPSRWTALLPDQKALDPACSLVDGFNRLDRGAVYGGYIHRDLVWLEHLGAAFAVLVAVLGHLIANHAGENGTPETWRHHVALLGGGVELLTLGLVALMVIGARRTALHDRWTALRLGAEQLRIAIMSMPLLVLPSAFATADKEQHAESHGSKETQFGFLALTQAKRIVRDHGLPHLKPDLRPADAADWLQLIVQDQLDYHRKNHRKLERAEHMLRRLTQLIFLIAVLAVCAHYVLHTEWLLLVTAAAPAFAAALHAIGTRLGISDRAELSEDIEAELDEIDKELTKVKAMAPGEDAWRDVRRLAFEAAEAMGRENSSWHGLVRRYPHELP